MNNLFNPLKANFDFGKFFVSVDIRSVFSFIPNVEPKSLSVYEFYHYLTRIGFLPCLVPYWKSFGKPKIITSYFFFAHLT